ncbi:MAG: hypothetical protein JSR54_18415, partial [Proteobacteria bacterium]|nr:hypothetical protein [Pseudomonadota bacterium]
MQLGRFDTLAGRLLALQLLVHAILPPALFLGLDAVIRAGVGRAFTEQTRAYARSLVSELQQGDIVESPTRTVLFLDEIVQGGRARYAAIDVNGRLLGSTIAETPGDVRRRPSEEAFGASDDNLFAMAMPIHRGTVTGTLYLGFDERPALEQVRGMRRSILVVLAVYVLASLASAVLLARLISRPLTRLQQAAEVVASGDPRVR